MHFDGALLDLRTRTGHRVKLTVDFREEISSERLIQVTEGLPVEWEKGIGLRHRAEFSRLEVPGAEVIKRLVNDCHVSDLHLAEAEIQQVVAEIYRNSRGDLA